MCPNFDNSNKLKLWANFTTPWNLGKNIVAYFLFPKKEQEKWLKWKGPCAHIAMVIQSVSQVGVRNHFESDDIIKWEEKEKSD